ncbi:MAG: RidA family protein [Clostridiales Family XIII bacterium]|jgi:2-iminobutanoate/2-iminopropanoate deaminase|nr:RidA family protein [Clostridiales Family XIII bacterium]
MVKISTDKAPAAIGPYVQANRVGDFLYTSGQLALDPESGALVGGTAAEQTTQALKNVQAILEAAGASLADVVKTTVFVTDIGEFANVNEAYAAFFAGDALPARSAVQVAALPKGALVEIETVAYLG